LYRKAETRIAIAQCKLGFCCAEWTGGDQRRERSSLWYRKAAEQGYASAQCNLGVCYEKGQGVIQRPRKKQSYGIVRPLSKDMLSAQV
jgi:TPR repeat protein